MGISITTELETETCCACGMLFAMPAVFERARRRDHALFYCPAGHSQFYDAETEETKLRRERDRLKQALAERDDTITEERRRRVAAEAGEQAATERATAERRRANGYKGHATRITKRAQGGVCPCCNRTFAALAAHMRTKHPEFTPLAVVGE